jgi:pimeloyl-ACP methyl ester carboxylesterase
MATFVLIPGAGGDSWYWHRVAGQLRATGHDPVAVDLPAGDDSAGLAEYTDVVLTAIGDRRELVVVGQSMGGLIAPLVADRVPVNLLVLLNAMVPRPGETGGQWWGVTGQSEARAQQATDDGRSPEFDLLADFLHDVPPDIVEAALARGETPQSDRPFADPWPLPAWPPVPTRVLAGRDDRFFPLEFQRRVARERLGLEVDEIPGGHLAALSRPAELVEQLQFYLDDALEQASPT